MIPSSRLRPLTRGLEPLRLIGARRKYGIKSAFTNMKYALGIEDPVPMHYPSMENRFCPWDTSSSPDLRARAALIRARAKCPVTGKNINFTCPKSGIPTHHDEEAWKSDKYHQEHLWKILKLVNVYEHDLRSGRDFPELDFPYESAVEEQVNLYNWDTFFFSRGFSNMDSDFFTAVVTKTLSYPLTIGSILHKNSPYYFRPHGNSSSLTLEGLKSLAALRYTMFPIDLTRKVHDRPMRIFLLGARTESQLPLSVWKQLGYLAPNVKFEIVFIGPEAHFDVEKKIYLSSDKKFQSRLDEQITFSYYTDYFHVLNDAQDFMPYDPYLDVFFLFHPGFGAPEAMGLWERSVQGLLESKCAVFVTGFHETDRDRDWAWLNDKFGKEMDVLLHPRENIYKSTKWELNDLCPSEVYQLNQQVFGFRGKRYHAIRR